MFDVWKFLQYISQSTIDVIAIQNQLNSIVSLSEAVLVAAAGKVETSHQPLQVSNLPIHMYPALQMMKAKVLPMNLEGEIFVVD